MTDRPTPAQVRKARKAELVAWCEAFGLNAEGKVDELRARLLDLLAKPEEAAPVKEAAKEEAEAEAPEAEEAEEVEPPKAGKGKAKAAKKEEGEERKTFSPKSKPKLDASVRRMLQIRRDIDARRPRFVRQEWFTRQRLGIKWRKPVGMHSKLRRHLGYRPNVVSIGYRGPKTVRGLHPSGFREVLVRTVRDLEAINSNVEAARIAASVGARRRTEIQAAADEKGIRVLNRREEE